MHLFKKKWIFQLIERHCLAYGRFLEDGQYEMSLENEFHADAPFYIKHLFLRCTHVCRENRFSFENVNETIHSEKVSQQIKLN